MQKVVLTTFLDLHKKINFWMIGIFVSILLVIPSVQAENKTPWQAVDIQLPPILRHVVIQAIHRDKNGFLWIGSQRALYKFDGFTLEKFGPSETGSQFLADSYVTAIAENSSGQILIGTLEGNLYLWNKATHSFNSIESLTKKDLLTIRSIQYTDQGQLWVASQDMISLFDKNRNVIREWVQNTSADSSAHDFSGLAQLPDQSVVIGSTDGIVKADPGSAKLNHIKLQSLDIPLPFQVTALALLDEKQLVIGTNTGHVAIVDLVSEVTTTLSRIPTTGPAYVSSLVGSDSGILIGSDRGLYWASRDLNSIYTLDPSDQRHGAHEVFSLLADRNILWVGTFNGLTTLSDGQFSLPQGRNRSWRGVSDLTEDLDHNLWIGTLEGLYKLDRVTSEYVRYGKTTESGLADQRVSALATRKDTVWIGTFKGQLQTLNVRLDKFENINLFDISSIEIPDLLYLESTDEMWIATNKHGLFRISNGKQDSFLQSGDLKEKQIIRLFPQGSTGMIALTYDGVFLYDRAHDTFAKIDFDFGALDKQPTILSLTESADGNIWIGTDQSGLYIWSKPDSDYAGKKNVPLVSSNTLNKTTLYDFLQDENGDIWASTRNGIVKLDSLGNLLHRFTMADGLQARDFTWRASYKGHDGALYFAGINGYNKFYPDQVEVDTTPPRTILSAVRYPNKSYINIASPQNEAAFEITYKDHYVTFEFSASDFVGYQENRFRYKLEGFDPEWRDNGMRNSATYTNLPPGEYLLRASAANAAGIWDPNGLSIPVRVLPPPWLSWWAYCIYALVGVLSLWVLQRAYQSYVIERKAAALAQEMTETIEYAENELQEQLEFQDEILKSAYDHKQDTLALVSAVLEDLAASDSGAEGGAKLLRTLARLEGAIFYGADGASANLYHFVDSLFPKLLEQARIDPHSVILVNQLPVNVIPAPACSILAVILYELLENCIQHAFEPTSPVHYITLRLKESFDSRSQRTIFKLTIADDGIGAPKSLFDQPPPDSGAANILAILRRFAGEIEITTLPGTKITITLPESETSVRG